MTQENYREKIEEHRQEIEFDGPLERKSRTSKKPRQRKSRLIRNMTIFFIFIPLLFLGYVHFFYEPKSLAVDKDDSVTVEPNKPSIENNEEQIAAAENEKEEQEAAKEKAEKEAAAKAQAEKEAEEKAKAEKEAIAKAQAEKEAAAKAQAEKEAAAKAQAEKQAKEDAERLAAAKTHVVQPNENLYRISLKYYSDGNGVQKIMQANNLSSENIVVGQTLIIPQ
ncbi:LysM peptidoglycan-binding domain-containing protein [Metasolibacillus meyeri]|uniref:LysM peptidoglycan-binding domain-containing protein n=1 Tax=Metasolibacillus meyeri TaxID=1071052 RepID=A0AAW9NXB2_9BACL|nr:LysM peptidoglycan-binding domain-containing protein [Metasolibacillus meyeri]MEC1179123.1 LysM peptidoglycan-binding domain-containing protein [Metasolibacillus meyeri]